MDPSGVENVTNDDVEMTEAEEKPLAVIEKDSKTANVNKKTEKRSAKGSTKIKKGKTAKINIKREVDEDEEDEKDETEKDNNEPPKVYIPGRYELEDDEELECDESAYVMLHRFTTEHPCLSFDAIYDNLGENRTSFPMACTLVAGTTQAPRSRDNAIVLMKLDNLQKIKQKDKDDDSSSSSSDDSDEEDESKPGLFTAKIAHHGGINRIRACKGMNACAAWNDQGKVQIWNLSSALNAVETWTGGENKTVTLQEKPLFSFSGHQVEGFAMDWSKLVLGKLASGDIRKNIHVWRMMEGGAWAVDQKPLSAHKSSVEDLQWSPNEDDMLASCSSDKTIRLWDTRCSKGDSCVVVVERAHDSDVNVISWNPSDPSLLLSGGDDGALKVWDWKFISRGTPVALLKHHTGPITSVNWYAGDSTVFAASGEDNQVTVWDLAVEPDDEREMIMENEAEKKDEVPSQLLFIHQGQSEIKEIQWHPQMQGVIVSTALDGFNIFRTVSV